jgi:hypothetical protein
VLCDPDNAFVPLHAPEAVQLVASVVFHESVDAPPAVTLDGDAARLIVGAALACVTITDALCDALPEAPLHVSVNVLLALSGSEVCAPAVALAPLQAPDALQFVALLADHAKVTVLPAFTEPGVALSDTVGGWAGGCVAVTLTFTV